MKFMPHFKFDIIGLGLKGKQIKTVIVKRKLLPQSVQRFLSYLSKDLWGSFWLVCSKGGILSFFSSFSASCCLLCIAHLLPQIIRRHSCYRTLTLAQIFLKFAFFCLLMALKPVACAVWGAAGLTIDSGCLQYTWTLACERGRTEGWRSCLSTTFTSPSAWFLEKHGNFG